MPKRDLCRYHRIYRLLHAHKSRSSPSYHIGSSCHQFNRSYFPRSQKKPQSEPIRNSMSNFHPISNLDWLYTPYSVQPASCPSAPMLKGHRLSPTSSLPSKSHGNYFRSADQVHQILEEGIFNSALEAGTDRLPTGITRRFYVLCLLERTSDPSVV